MMPAKKSSIWDAASHLKKKIGDVIDDAFVEKEFVLKDSFTANQFQQLFADIPAEEVEAVKQVVDEAEQVLGSRTFTEYLLNADGSYSLCFDAGSRRNRNTESTIV